MSPALFLPIKKSLEQKELQIGLLRLTQNIMNKLLYSSLLFLCSMLSLSAQVEFLAAETEVCAIDGTAVVNFTINTEENLGAFQYAVVWDTDVLENPVLEDFSLGDNSYNDNNSDEGELRVGWFNSGGEGEFTPGQLLFTLTFDHVAGSADFTEVVLTDLPGYSILVARNDASPVPPEDITLTDGSITYGDTEMPVINNCPDDITVNVPFGQNNAVVTWADVQPTDNCGVTQLNQSNQSGDSFPLGDTEVTITAEDAAANVSQPCVFTVTVQTETDDTPLTINITGSNSPDCGDSSVGFAFTVENFVEMTGYQFGIVWDAALLTYVDSTDNFSANNIFNIDNAAAGELRVGWFNGNGQSLNDGDLLFTLNFVFIGAPGTEAAIEIVAFPDYPIFFADENGQPLTPNMYELNPGSVTGNATDQPPVLNGCPTGIFDENTADACTVLIDFALPTVTDDCDADITVVQTSALGAGDDFPLGETVVSYSATDSADNEAACSFTVNVAGTNSITLGACPSNQNIFTEEGMCSANTIWTPPTAANECNGEPTLTSNYNPTFDFPVGSTVVTYTAENADGQTASCSFTIMVSDTLAPQIICPDNAVTETSEVTATFDDLSAAVTENCDFALAASITGATEIADAGEDVSEVEFAVGESTVTYTVTDASDSTAVCSFLVTVESVAPPPPLVCPDDLTTATDAGMCSAVTDDLSAMITDDITTLTYILDGAMVGGSNTTGINQLIGMTFTVGEILVTYNAENEAGDTFDCTFVVTVNDEENPVLTCPEDIEILLPAGENETAITWDAVTVTDNCTENLTATSSAVSGDTYTVGEYTVTYTAADAADNEGECTFNILIEAEQDNDCPAEFLTCPANINQATDAELCGAAVTWELPTTDENCDLTISAPPFAPGDTFTPGTTTLIYVVTNDNTGNSTSCTFSVTVTDAENPVNSLCPANATIGVSANQCTAAVTWEEPTFDDNCDNLQIISTHTNGSDFTVGQYPITYTATDAAGNTAQCQFTVNVVDTQPPVALSVPPNLTVSADADECGAIVTWQTVTFTDNCGISNFMCSNSSGEFFPIGEHTVSCTVFDSSDNMTTVSFTVTVTDNTPPDFVCPAPVEVSVTGDVISDPDEIIDEVGNAGCDGAEINFTLPQASDACSQPVSVQQTEGEYEDGDVFPTGAYTLEYTATDVVGNQTVCFVDITVAPEVEPEFSTDFGQGICEGLSGKICVDNVPGASYAWFDFENNIISTDQCLQLDDVTLEMSGEYMVAVQTAAGCDYFQSYTFIVYAAPVLEINVAPLLCTDGTENLEFFAEDAAATNVTSYEWTTPAGQVINVQNLEIADAVESDAGIYYLTAINENGCIDQSNEEAVITVAPTTPTVFASTQFLCEGNSAVLSADTDLPDVSYVWTASPAENAGLPASPSGQQITVTPQADGEYIYSVTATSGACTSEAGSISVTQQTTPELSIAAAGNMTCVNGTSDITLTETGGDAESWAWTGPNGYTATGNSITLENVTATDAGLYTVTSGTSIGCTASATYQLSLTEQPTGLAAAFSDGTLCDNENAQLNITGLTGDNITYTFSNQNGAETPVPTANTTVNFGSYPAGNYSFWVTATVNGCESEPAGATFSVQASPNAAVTLTGDTECVTGDNQIVLSGIQGAESYAWTKNAGSTVLSTDPTLVLQNAGADDSGIYTLTVTSNFGCEGEGERELEITEGVEPVAVEFSNAGCLGEVVQLQAIDDNIGLAYRWLLDGVPVFNERNPMINALTENRAGDYEVVVINPQSGCTDTSEVRTLNVLTAPVTEEDFGLIFLPTPNIELTLTDNDLLEENTEYTVTIIQEPEFGRVEVLDPTKGMVNYIRETEVARTDRFFYEVCYDDCDRACERNMVTINIKYNLDECVVTNLISPNGDGTNDVFTIYCLEDGDFNDNTLTVYNQWGDRVYHAAPYTNDWSGTHDGQSLPDGTYYYTFRRDAQSEVQKGHITIFR